MIVPPNQQPPPRTRPHPRADESGTHFPYREHQRRTESECGETERKEATQDQCSRYMDSSAQIMPFAEYFLPPKIASFPFIILFFKSQSQDMVLSSHMQWWKFLKKGFVKNPDETLRMCGVSKRYFFSCFVQNPRRIPKNPTFLHPRPRKPRQKGKPLRPKGVSQSYSWKNELLPG